MKETALKNLLRECSALITEKTQEIYNLIPGTGDPESKVMVVTSYPSAKEEMTEIYFEGNAGRAYESFLKTIGYKRDEIYTTYTVKYRPYKISGKSGRIINREVTMEEVEMFYNFLVSEIEVIQPSVIITLGDLAYAAIHNMEQSEGASYGLLKPIKINGHLYELLPLPHPSESAFSKVCLPDETVNRLQFLETTTTAEATVGDGFIELDEIYQVLDEVTPTTENIKPMEVIYNPVNRSVPKRKKNKISGKHRVVLVYGGSQLSDDPSFVIAERVSDVLAELNVGLTRFDLYKNSYHMESFFDALAEADGVIIVTTVEWYGIGGLLQTFLDKAYMSGQLDIFEGTYLFNIVISRHSFEREGLNHVLSSWEILGGIEGVNLCASIKSSADIETSGELLHAIERKAEDYYRILNQQHIPLPTSINENKVIVKVYSNYHEEEGEQMVLKHVVNPEKKEETIDNQMSFITDYAEFIEKQQKDIEDIASLFKERLATGDDTSVMTVPELFEYKFKPDKSFNDCHISWVVNDASSQNFVLEFKGSRLNTIKGKKSDAEVIISSNYDVLQKITENKLTVQRAFMTGEIKAKGNFTLLYKLDGLFAF